MKRILSILTAVSLGMGMLSAQNDIAKEVFDIKAGDLKLSLMVGSDNRLYQLHFGDADKKVNIPEKMPPGLTSKT